MDYLKYLEFPDAKAHVAYCDYLDKKRDGASDVEILKAQTKWLNLEARAARSRGLKSVVFGG